MSIIKSKWTVPIPSCSLPTWLFGSPDGPLKNADKPVYIDAERPDTHFLTQATFRLWAKRFAVGLLEAGLQPGDRVLLFSGNDVFFPVVLMGVVMAGGIFTPANPTFVARELAHQLKDSEAKFLLCAEGPFDVALEAAANVGMGKERVFLFDDIAENAATRRQVVESWSTLIASEEKGNSFVWTDPVSPSTTTCCMYYSSGTTGFPKGVEMTHSNYVTTSEHCLFLDDLDPRTAIEKWLCQLPMYHAWAQFMYCVYAPKCSIPVYVMPKIDLLQSFRYIQQFRITTLSIAVPMVSALAKHPAARTFDLSSVRFVITAGAALSPAIAREFSSLWPPGHVVIQHILGTTETVAISTWATETPIPLSIGLLVPNCEARIVSFADDHDSPEKAQDVQRNQPGELWVRGPIVMKGYWRNPAATAASITPDGWYRTGDLVYADERDRFFIVGRKKEVIKVEGGQVSPAELEAVLLSHEKVLDAAVTMVAVEGEERPRAYIVPKSGLQVPLTEEDVVRWMETRVAPHKQITGGVIFVETIPKNQTGKILRKDLLDSAMLKLQDN